MVAFGKLERVLEMDREVFVKRPGPESGELTPANLYESSVEGFGLAANASDNANPTLSGISHSQTPVALI